MKGWLNYEYIFIIIDLYKIFIDIIINFINNEYLSYTIYLSKYEIYLTLILLLG